MSDAWPLVNVGRFQAEPKLELSGIAKNIRVISTAILLGAYYMAETCADSRSFLGMDFLAPPRVCVDVAHA
jgi:hypothetical protein